MVTINEAVDKFGDLIKNPKSSLEDLSQLVNELSVKDNVAPKSAETHLYTRVKSKEFITDSVRALDHTDAYDFLDVLDEDIRNYIIAVIRRDNPHLSNKAIINMAEDYFYGNFKDGNSIKGLWGEISERFARDTEGAVICHIGDLDSATDRIWWNVEMPQLMDADSKVTSINGINADELRKSFNELGGGSNAEALDKINRTVAESVFEKQQRTNNGADIGESNADNKGVIDKENVIEDGNKVKDKSDSTEVKDNSEKGKEEIGDSESKKDVKDEAADSESKKDMKEETVDSETKKEVKEEVTDSETKKDTKEKIDESTTKKDTTETGKGTNESSTKKENVGNESDFENKKSNPDGTKADSDMPAKKSESVGDLDGKHTSDGSKIVDKADTGNGNHTTSDGKSNVGADKSSTGNGSHTTSDGINSAVADKGSTGNTSHTTSDGGSSVEADKGSAGNTSHTTPDGSSPSGNKKTDGFADAGAKIEADIGGNKSKKTGLTDNGQKIVDSYEKASGKKVDLDGKSGLAKKISKCADILDKVGDGFDLLDAGKMIYETATKISNGDIDGACKVMSDYGFSTLGGIGAGALATLILGMGAVNPVLGFAFVAAMGWWGSEMGQDFSDWWFREVLGLYDEAGAYTYPVDPLILDLDGDGIETISVKDGVNFDFDNNGFAEKTGWVGKDDGLLVRDINHNGQIDNGGELFGDLTAADEFEAKNGFEALKYYDTNGDNIINHLDEIYSELRVWQDANQNGKVDTGELHRLEELGIAGFDLNYENINETDTSGNSHTQKGAYIKTDGSSAVMEDVWFDKDASNTVVVDATQYGELLKETDEIKGLPDIRGYGNQYSLHQAMLRDETGELQSLIEQYIAEGSAFRRKAMITNIIYVWTGVEDESSTARGNNLSDSRKLEALEVVTGRDFESAYGANPVYQAGQYIEQAFNKLIEMYYAELERQTTYDELYQHLYENIDVDANGKLFYDTQKVMEVLAEKYAENQKEGRNLIIHFISNVKKTGFISMINEEALFEQLVVFGADIMHEIDYAGDDIIDGTNGNDVLNGELGNDRLKGGWGDDAYVFNIGDGEDIISESGGTDRIVFGEGIAAEDIHVTRDAWNLYLTNKESGDRITVEGFFQNTNQQVEKVAFADGSEWSIDDLKDKARHYYGTAGNDSISASDSYYYAPTNEDDYLYGGTGDDKLYGNSGNDELYGEEGNDTLDGGNGNDVLNGGTGNDRLKGGWGDDTYIFNIGDGQDTIQDIGGNDRIVFGEGIDSEDLMFSKDGSNLNVSVFGQDDEITVLNYFSNESYRVESIQTSDGTKFDYTKIELMVQAMAAFDDSKGMMLETVNQNANEQMNDSSKQMWTKALYSCNG